MATPSLYDEGWRQGALLRKSLAVQSLDFLDNEFQKREHSFELWMLATQDCDLASTKATNGTRNFELRPVYQRTADDKVDGIRSRVMRIANDLVLRADCPRHTLTARALTAMKEHREELLDDLRRREVRTWLGLRYDRPAVPKRFEQIPIEILKPLLLDGMPAELAGKIRDILVYYHTEKKISLSVVLRRADDRAAVLEWIDEMIDVLDSEHSITVNARFVEDASKTPLSVIETYYGLDSAELSGSANVSK